ncbi:MAG: leucyl/phenylalanyl-tRNA--protein transferase [Marinomonas sp.]
MNEQKQLLILSEDILELPDPNLALDDPDGLAAIGGDLSNRRLIHLYQHGFFPWYSESDPILWWHPSLRCQLNPSNFHCSKSLKKHIRKFSGQIRINTEFETVIQHCAQLRQEQEGTWISDEIVSAFVKLHNTGYAHSIEVWQDKQLIGGFYGVAMGRFFFGESMFSLEANASKLALYSLCLNANALGIEHIDCQVESEHLMSLGASLIPRKNFIEQLQQAIPKPEKNQNLINQTHLDL